MKNKFIIIALILLAIFCLASCGEERFSITYYNHDQSICDVDYYSQKNDPVLNVFNREGYKFLGYYTEDGAQYYDNTGKRLSNMLIESDMTLYAKYEPNSYKFIFTTELGTFENGLNQIEKEFKHGESLVGKWPSISIDDPQYELEDWYDEGKTKKYTENGELLYPTVSSQDYPLNGDGCQVKLTARLKVKDLTVTIDFNDGVTPLQQIKVKYGQPIGDLSSYYKDTGERDIVGWSSASYANIPLPEIVTENITIYGVWAKYKNVTFVYPNGEERVQKVHMIEGESSVLPSNDEPGYEFQGWYLTSAYSGNPISSIPSNAVADKYYGKWKLAIYTITFDTGFDVEYENISYYYGDTTELPRPEIIGHQFLGWSIEGGEEKFYSIPAQMYGDKKLIASFAPIKYSITLKPMGGTIEETQYVVEYGTTYKLNVPQKEGYTFLGWYDSLESGNRMTSASGASLTELLTTSNVEYYAIYEINVYTVEFNTDGGTTIENHRYQHGKALKLPQEPKKEGVMFLGWFNETGDMEYTSATEVKDNLTLYAKWIDSKSISTPDELKAMINNPQGNYHLTADINLSGEGWTIVPEFSGVFNGQGYKIYNFTINTNVVSSACVGFVGTNRGIIKNLTISDAVINCITTTQQAENSLYCVGGLVGVNVGRIVNCHVISTTIQCSASLYPNRNQGTATSTNTIGGIAGDTSVNGIIDECTSNATIKAGLTQAYEKNFNNGNATGHGGIYAGGISGTASNPTVKIRNCSYTGRIEASTNFTGTSCGANSHNYCYAGGIVPINNGIIENCFTEAEIIAVSMDSLYQTTWQSDTYSYVLVGGISAENKGKILTSKSSSYVYGDCQLGGHAVNGNYVKQATVGGIVALNSVGSSIENCYSLARVQQVNGNSNATGGAIGINEGSVRNTYAYAELISSGASAGGFTGINGANGTIINCIMQIAMKAYGGSADYFVGSNAGVVSGCYYASESQFKYNDNYVPQSAQAGISILSASQLLTKDFINNTLYWESIYWNITDGEAPALYWETVEE